MLYLPDSRALYLHCPKTAGMWTRRAIVESGVRAYGCGYQTADAVRAEEEMGLDLMRFCFIRHPAAWLRSFWCDRMLNGFGGDVGLGRFQVHDFNLYASTVAREEPGAIGQLFDRYTMGAFRVGRVERLAADLLEILRALGECPDESALQLSPTNRASSLPRLSAMSEYRPEVYQAVCEAEAETLKRYGYGYEP